jgi:alkylhydroperoxidase family enzyme
MSARLAPLDPPFAPDLQAFLDRIMPPGVPPLVLFTTLARDARLFERFRGGGLLDKGHLTLRQREIVIGRVAAQSRSEYEWGVHTAFFAERVGLDDAMQRSLVLGSGDDPCWSSAERALIRACDELHATADLSDEAWGDLRRHLTEMAVVEVVMLAGFYRTVSYLTNTLRLPLETFAKRFPV